MEAPRIDPSGDTPERVDWEAFYRNYRKPGYVPGFEIVNKLGGGMFGLVFKARKESIGKDYAIKFLKVDDETVRDAVARELETVRFFAQIDHPNLVSIEDKGIVDGIPFLVMSYAGQETLQRRLQQGRLGREEALRIFAQAARGVQALHEHSLVHFDIKPANVFLKGEVARIGDYGLSKLVSESRNSLSFSRGTPYYMAPEMLQRRGDVRSDIYSLGVLLYECLYGDVPFRGDSEWEVLRKHETADLEFPEDSRPSDREIIRRCMAKDPGDRYASVADLLRALQAPVTLGESLVLSGASSARSESPRKAPPEAEPRPSPPPLDSRGFRDPARSPYGLPWRKPEAGSGPISRAVGLFFQTLSVLVTALVVPIRLIGASAGRVVAGLIRVPGRILGLLVQLVGLLFVVGLVVLAAVAVARIVGMI